MEKQRKGKGKETSCANKKKKKAVQKWIFYKGIGLYDQTEKECGEDSIGYCSSWILSSVQHFDLI